MRDIIIITSNEELCNNLTALLTRAQYCHIHSSCNCRETLNLIYHLNPKLIIVDLKLSPDDLAEILKLLSTPVEKIILFVAPPDAAEADLAPFIKEGNCNVISLPIDEKSLLKQVRGIIESD